MKTDIKRLILPNLPYLFIFCLAAKAGEAWRLAVGGDFGTKLLHLTDGFAAAFQSPLPSFHPQDLLVGLVITAVVRLAVYVKGKNARKYRKGIEYGSARWGTAKDIQPFINPKFSENIILTETERLTTGQVKHPDFRNINHNVLIIGGSGSGKTRYHIKPNLMQMNASYLVTDPKGTVIVECGRLLERNGYKIKVLNTIDFSRSMHYNPFRYIRKEEDISPISSTTRTLYGAAWTAAIRMIEYCCGCRVRQGHGAFGNGMLSSVKPKRILPGSIIKVPGMPFSPMSWRLAAKRTAR